MVRLSNLCRTFAMRLLTLTLKSTQLSKIRVSMTPSEISEITLYMHINGFRASNFVRIYKVTIAIALYI